MIFLRKIIELCCLKDGVSGTQKVSCNVAEVASIDPEDQVIISDIANVARLDGTIEVRKG